MRTMFFYWYVMTIPMYEWRTGSGKGDHESYGILENRSMGGCHFRIMHDVYPYLQELRPELEFSREHLETENLSTWIYTSADDTINPGISYFDVEDKTESRVLVFSELRIYWWKLMRISRPV